MEDLIVDLINRFGYLGIFFLITLENIFPPIPSEVILTFSGFMTTESNLTIFGSVFFSSLGSVLGAIILYFIGNILHKDRLKKIISGKLGKFLCLNEKDIEKANNWFERKENKTVFFCRFIPVVRSLISLPAGMAKMNLIQFIIYTLTGSLLWNFILIFLGNRVGKNWKNIVNLINNYSHIVLFMFIIVFIGFIIYNSRRKKR